MSNQFSGVGNIGQAPVLRTVKVAGENRPVADLRVFFDRSIPLEDGTYEDGGGFWLTVSAWGHRAESAVKLLSKGMRIHVTGGLRLDNWENEGGEARTELRLTADHISIDPICLDSVKVRKRNGQVAENTGNAQADIDSSNIMLPANNSQNTESYKSGEDVSH